MDNSINNIVISGNAPSQDLLDRLDAVRKNIQDFDNLLTTNNGLIASENTKLIQLEQEKANAEQTKAFLESEHARLKAELAQAVQSKSTLSDKLRGKQLEFITKQAQLLPIEQERRVQEQKFVSDIEGITKEALIGYLNDHMTKIDTEYSKYITGKKSEDDKKINDFITNEFKERYFNPPSRPRGVRYLLPGGNEERTINTDQLNEDYITYKSGGVKSLIREIVGSHLDGEIRRKYGIATGNMLPADIQKEYDKRLEEVTSKYGNDALIKLLSMRTRAGDKISLPDARLIQNYNPGIIEEMIKYDKNLRDEMEKIIGTGSVDNISRMPTGRVWRALLYFFGGFYALLRWGFNPKGPNRSNY